MQLTLLLKMKQLEKEKANVMQTKAMYEQKLREQAQQFDQMKRQSDFELQDRLTMALTVCRHALCP